MRSTRVILSGLIILSTSLAFAAPVISDSLVRGLDCAKLRKETFLRSIDRKGFAAEYQLPIRNWGANLLGQCWALSLAQRRFFYLARTEVAGASISAKRRQYALDLFRGSHRDCDDSAFGGAQQCVESPLRLKVLPVREKSFGESALFMDAFQGDRDGRSVRTEIEMAQQLRFYNLGNLDLVTIDDRGNRAKNQRTLLAIQNSVSRGRMPLLILNFETASQHAVLVKNVAVMGDARLLTVYDSNNPTVDMTISYRDGLFFGNEIAQQLRPAAPGAPIGVSVRDEDQMDAIEDALFAHYQSVCRGR